MSQSPPPRPPGSRGRKHANAVEVSTSDLIGYARTLFRSSAPISNAARKPFQVVTDDRDDGAQARPETRDPVPRRGQPDPVAVAVPAAAEAMTKLAALFALLAVACGLELRRIWRDLNAASWDLR